MSQRRSVVRLFVCPRLTLPRKFSKMLVRSVAAAFFVVVGFACANSDDGEFGAGARLLLKMFDDCRRKGFEPCIKMKAITFFDRASRSREINLGDAVSVVRDESAPPLQGELLTEKDLEAFLPRGSEAERDARLNSILFSRVADFFNSHKLVLALPKLNPLELQEGVEEGRGKMKKMMSMMMMGFAMKMATAVPMAIGLLFLLAGKALIISKIALVLSLIMALKKLMSQKQGHGHEVTWQSGGGWDRRSFLVPHSGAQEMAYRGHLVNTFSSPGKH